MTMAGQNMVLARGFAPGWAEAGLDYSNGLSFSAYALACTLHMATAPPLTPAIPTQGLDIGPDSVELVTKALDGAKTIIWNGPMGES